MKPASAALPADLAKVRELIDAWRANASPRARLPEAFWGPVLDLLATHTITVVSRALDLDSERLRRRRKALQRAAAPTLSHPPAQFLEIVPSRSLPTHACRTGPEVAVCLERQDGLRVTVSLPTDDWTRVQSLVCALATVR
jgi:hypothetical protein